MSEMVAVNREAFLKPRVYLSIVLALLFSPKSLSAENPIKTLSCCAAM